MKLSIIVPVYNAEKFLDRCVLSLVNQKGLLKSDYEIILVNDCSPDDSLSVMYQLSKRYSESGSLIRVIDSKENLRQGGARNLGINLAQGDYIAFVDSDDFVAEDAFLKMLDEANSSDIVFSKKYYEVIGSGEVLTVDGGGQDLNGILSLQDRRKILVSNPSVWNTVYKKKFLDDYNLRFVEKTAYEDNLFVYQVLFYAETAVFVDHCFYYYVQQPQSTCHVKDSLYQTDRFKIIKLLNDFFVKNDTNNEFKDEKDYLIIRQGIVNGRKNALRQYSKPNIFLLKYIKKEICPMVERYAKNAYYKTMYDKKNRIAMLIANVSPRLFALAFNGYFKNSNR